MAMKHFKTLDVIETCIEGASKTLLFEEEVVNPKGGPPATIVQAKDTALYYVAYHEDITDVATGASAQRHLTQVERDERLETGWNTVW